MSRSYIITSITRDDLVIILASTDSPWKSFGRRVFTVITGSRSRFGSCRWYRITRNPNTDVIFCFERFAIVPDGGVPLIKLGIG
jgi:hypothetical protein